MEQYFILRDEKRREDCINFIRSAPLGYAVEVKPHKKTRSKQQNRFLWSLYRSIQNTECGHNEEELHEMCKVRFLGVEEKMVSGRLLVMPKSTAKLGVAEMNRYLTMVEAFAHEAEARFMRPDDYAEIMTLTVQEM